MKAKQIIITLLICSISLMVFVSEKLYFVSNKTANSYYKVYLKGKEIGLIESKDELYDLINTEQENIRNTYNIDTVYPPSDFELVQTNTFSQDLSTASAIYKKIENADNFTIKGYIISLKNDEETKEIYVIDKTIFENALKNFVHAFVDEETYQDYINNTQDEIIDVGSIIDKMYFKESISIKEGYISVSDKIFTDEKELSQYLLFGENADINEYTVKLGDTLESIAEDNKLNVQELLISNPEYRDENAILAIGDKMNVTYLNPVLNLVQEIHKVEDVEAVMETKVEYDNTKPYSYSEITTPGVTGITRLTQEYQVVNGESSNEVKITNKVTIREAVTQVTTKGRKSYYTPNITGTYVDNGQEWGWPTNSPYIISSQFSWRWGKHHDGLDITGTGEGSPIYAAGSGTVIQAGWGGQALSEAGVNVIIQHDNDIYTLYAHMRSTSVRVGQTVTKGQVIGTMGHTGYAFGTHLHFSASKGNPYRGSYAFFNPLNLYK